MVIGIGVFLFVFRRGEVIVILYVDWSNLVEEENDLGRRSESY